MKKIATFLAAIMLAVSLCACTNTQATSSTQENPSSSISTTSTASTISTAPTVTIEPTASTVPKIEEKNTVVVLATGGTIAGSGQEGKSTGYVAGSLTVESLLQSIPQIKDVANIEAIQICNVASPDITSEIWIKLANTINELSQNPNVSGFVVTHGTDTMDETAYFLNLTVKTDKPVVLTGSMRPATSLSADGPMNLYQAVCVANSKSSVGKGVLVVFSDKIYSARSVIKTSTYNVMAISAGEMGALGMVRDNEVFWYEAPTKLHTTDSEFDVSKLSKLPKVSVVYFNVDADPEILRYATEHSDGIVIAGAGAGSVSDAYIYATSGSKVPVVVSSRIGDGIIQQGPSSIITANNLPPQKAAVLLRLALTQTTDPAKIVEMFGKY